MQWSIPLVALSDAEVDALAELFEAAEGRLGTFTFLDPASNLLSWSENFSKPVWSSGPMLQQAAGVPDPKGTHRATRFVNAGQAPQRLAQTIAVPTSFAYCLSIFARSSGGAAITLVRNAGGVEQKDAMVVDSQWRRLTSSGVLGGSDFGVTFAVELQPGAMAELFGIQVEAQVAPSEYMVTRGIGGVYPAARFDDDTWVITAQGPGRSDTVVKIVSADGD